MKVRIDNVDLTSSSGPNNFASKLVRYFTKNDIDIVDHNQDVQLSFIQQTRESEKQVLRLDGIYFNTKQDWQNQNFHIEKSYNAADRVIVQSSFNKKLVQKYFGNRENIDVIHNGTCLDLIEKIKPATINRDSFGSVWFSASSWRPHKRLSENIRLFLEFSGQNDIMLIAGENTENQITDPRIINLGKLSWENMISVMKASDNFIHLAWLDHCPNVVVDAKASGCKLYCTDAGGTVELADKEDYVILEEEWDFEPCELYNPPVLDFSRIKNGQSSLDYDITSQGKLYSETLGRVINEN